MFAPVPASPHPPFSTHRTAATYTLVCDVGTFSLAGQTIAFKVGRTIVCNVGLFSLAGQDAAFRYTRHSNVDTHDGFDEDVRKRVHDDEEAFRSKRDKLRSVIELAFEPEPGPVAAEVKAIAEPYVERLESGAPRIDYAALERNAAVMAEILAFQERLRAEFRARMDAANDDEDAVLMLLLN